MECSYELEHNEIFVSNFLCLTEALSDCSFFGFSGTESIIESIQDCDFAFDNRIECWEKPLEYMYSTTYTENDDDTLPVAESSIKSMSIFDTKVFSNRVECVVKHSIQHFDVVYYLDIEEEDDDTHIETIVSIENYDTFSFSNRIECYNKSENIWKLLEYDNVNYETNLATLKVF